MALPDTRLLIECYTHFVKVSRVSSQARLMLLKYASGMGEFKWEWDKHQRRNVRRMIRVYASAKRDRSEFRFHINQLADLRRFLDREGIGPSDVEVIVHPPYVPDQIEYRFIDQRVPRDYQIPQIEYITGPGVSKVCTIQTGGGKGLLSIHSLVKLGCRALIVVKPMYIDKWVEELAGSDKREGCFEFDKGELVVITGQSSLNKLIHSAMEGVKPQITIVSNATYRNWIRDYEEAPSFSAVSPIPPDALCEVLGVGLRIVDEVHQDYHFNFRLDLYTHAPKTLAMSATLEADSPTLNELYAIQWPMASRGPTVEYNKYIAMHCLWYSIRPEYLSALRWLGRQKAYSHVLLEQTIMRNRKILKSYLDMILDIVYRGYLEDRQPGQKMIIFCATVKMCQYVKNAISAICPELVVAKYTMEDSYEDMVKADIVVSTIGSAGTAIDIPNLVTTLMTNALSNKQANQQVVGRLRPVKDWPDLSPRFYFLSCRQIPKHCEYAAVKSGKLEGRVKSYRDIQTPYVV